MRGDGEAQSDMFSYRTPAQRVPADHPLRRIREIADGALRALSSDFDRMYSKVGRRSVPPEHLLRALLLQYLYGIRSERLLMEQLDYNMLFRWFVGLNMDDEVWVPTVFSKNRERLLGADIGQRFLREVVAQAERAGLTSDEHFSVDGTLIEAWASQKSFKPKEQSSGDDGPTAGGGRNPEVDFKGQQRRNDTHQSTTDPESRLYRKGNGHESRLSYMGHIVMENRSGLVVGAKLTQADGRAEREAASDLMRQIRRAPRATVGADKAYDTAGFVAEMRAQGVTPHVAQNTTNRRSAIDGRTTRHAGYAVSQVARKMVEHPFGWLKGVAGRWQVKFRGRLRVGLDFTFGMAAFNLVRIGNLMKVAA